MDMPTVPQRIRRYIKHQIKAVPKFVFALCFALLFATALTISSMIMYVSSGVSSIDLSRPGYEQARKSLKNDSSNQSFQANGPLDAKTIDTFNTLYNSEVKDMRNFGNFNDSTLDDSNLNLTPGQTTPTASP